MRNEALSAETAEYIASSQWENRFDRESFPATLSKVRFTLESYSDENNQLEINAKAELKSDTAQVSLFFWLEENQIQWDADCDCSLSPFCFHNFQFLKTLQKRGIEKFLEKQTSPDNNLKEVEELDYQFANDSEVDRVRTPPKFSLHLKKIQPIPPILSLFLKYQKQQVFESIICAEVFAHYGQDKFPLLAQIKNGETYLQDQRGSRIVERYQAIEKDAGSQLSQFGLSSPSSDKVFLKLLSVKEPAMLSSAFGLWYADSKLQEEALSWGVFRKNGIPLLEKLGWEVTVQEQVGHETFDCDPEEWKTEFLPEKGNWFSLSVGFSVQEKRYDLIPILKYLLKDGFLEATLDRPENGTQTVVLEDGNALDLPVGRVRTILKTFSQFLNPKQRSSPKIHALDLQTITEESPLPFELPESALNFSQILRETRQKSFVSPKGLLAELRDYQIQGVQWMQQLAHLHLNGILADDMGLGKTLQSIAHILLEKENGRSDSPTLVVAPTSVVTNWQKEIQKFAPQLRTLRIEGARRHSLFLEIPKVDVVLTSYALIARDLAHYKNFEFHLLFLDEAQYIKNPSAKVTQAISKLNSQHRICLSGTPVENNLTEFWSLMNVLMPSLFSTKEHFNQFYRYPIERDENEQRLNELQRRVSPLLLRRTKNEVAKELPPKTEINHFIELEDQQKDLYEAIRATMNSKIRQTVAQRGIEKSQFFFLEALLKLRQICCHPHLHDQKLITAKSSKFEFLFELLETLLLEDRKVLIFSQFTSMLEIISNELDALKIKHLMLTGETKDRAQLVDKFQSGSYPIFLISLKAGGTGLTLTAADTVIHYDPWWNPAVEAQATDRAYRIGQDKPVFVHKLYCKDTVEEKILSLQTNKAHLSKSLLTGANKINLTEDSVRDLLN